MKVGAGEFIKKDSGEVIWGSEAFIDEVFKTLYGNKFRNEIWSYNDALQTIKNLVQQQEDNWMELSYEEQVFLRLLMRDAWYDCDMRNKSDSERRLFLKIQSKLSQELINA